MFKMAIEKILWGDDQEGFLKGVKSALEPEYEVTIATRPEEVIEKASQEAFDIIITDLKYTKDGEEGFDVIRAVKDKVPYVTLCTSNDVEAKAKEAGAHALLKKPMRLRELKEYLGGLE